MNSTQLLSDIIVYSKYPMYLPELKRRETWSELVYRNMQMHIKRYPHMEEEIIKAYSLYVLPKKVFPSMRSLQFAGKAIEKNNSRIYNCSYTAIDSIHSFSEAMFLLLGGTGLGISVQRHHIDKLPEFTGPNRRRNKKHVIEDSIEGWATAVKTLIKSYAFNKMQVRFDYSDIRKKDEPLKTAGGLAPGPEPLKIALTKIDGILSNSVRNGPARLKPIEAFDIMCHIAMAVLSGGIRRAAVITLFSPDDNDMLESKVKNWREKNPHRCCSNNSVVLERDKITYEDFSRVWEVTQLSGCGEPGFTWTNDKDWGANPCLEVSLENTSFCNLTTADVSGIESQEDLNSRVKVASFLGTLQAGYTRFHYLRDSWEDKALETALIGVSMTGIASGEVLKYDLKEAAKVVIEENKRVAGLIGINVSERCTVIKPEGTASVVAGCSSGIHAYHAPYYIRRVRINKNEPLHSYLFSKLGGTEFLEDDVYQKSSTSVLNIPIKAPDNAIYRTESELSLLKRVERFQKDWIKEGHIIGANRNNVSVTVSIRKNKWDKVKEWMWKNREDYTGISVLPYDGGTYQQLPFEEITEERYEDLYRKLEKVDIDITEVEEERNLTNHSLDAACAGGSCEISSI